MTNYYNNKHHTRIPSLMIGNQSQASPPTLGKEKSYVCIDSSGTSVFAAAMKVGASGFSNPVMCVARVTIAGNNTAANKASIPIPAGSDIINMYVDVEDAFKTAAGNTAANVQISGAGGATLAVISVSASSVHYQLGGAQTTTFVGSGMRNIAKQLVAYVSIQGSNSAISGGQAMLSVQYLNNT